MDQILFKMDLDKLLDKVVRYFFDKNIFYCDSIDSYYSRKEPSLRRKTKFYLRFLLFAIVNFKYGLLLLYPGKLQWTLLKDATIMFGKQANLIHAIFFSFGMVTILVKLVVVYYERQKKIKVIDLVVDWKLRKPLYQMSQSHLKKLTLKSFILYYGFIKVTGSIVFVIIIFIVTWVTIVAYLYFDYGNVIILWLWSIIVMITFDHIIITLLFTTFLFFFPITLLNYLFDELIEKFRVSIRWNNEQRLHHILQSYNDLIGVVTDLSDLFNKFIGLVYCIVPYILSLFVELMQIDRDEILFKILKIIFFFLFIETNLTVFMINQLSASITVRNKSIHKYLYPMFCNEPKIKLKIKTSLKTKLRTKLAIDSFIARLNTQFIGFYCFNLFKFTKMTYYQYALSVSTCYFLITRVLNNDLI